MEKTDSNTSEYLQFLDEQKKQENELVNQRTNWGLASNSFLILATAIASNGTGSALFLYIVPVLGILVSFSTLIGVLAAHYQVQYIKEKWKDHFDWGNQSDEKKRNIVRPFGDRKVSNAAKYVSYTIFASLVIGWLSVLYINIVNTVCA